MTCTCEVTDTADTTPLSGLLRHIVPFAAKVPHAMALDVLRQNYIEFCRRTSILTQEITLDIVTGQTSYPLTPLAGYEVYMVKTVQNHNLFERVDYWPAYDGFPFHYKIEGNKSLILESAPTEDTTAGINLEVSLLPDDCTNVIPTSIANPFGRGIAMGAVADLLDIPNKEWTAMGLAERIRGRYYETIQSARNLSETNRQAGPMRMRGMRVI